MNTVSALLTELVDAATAAAGYGDAPVVAEPAVPTADPRHGDWQSNHAFRVAKALRKNPRQVADDVLAQLAPHPAIARAEVAGPGFLNFTLAEAWVGQEVAARASDARFGAPSPGSGRALVLDYSSPNIAKRMHVGHMRSTIIGNALHRMFQFLGWHVIADNHIGDWGTQFGKLIVAWRGWRDDAAYAADPIGELQRIYKLFGERAAVDPALDDAARAETVKLQEGDEENRRLWEAFCKVSLEEFEQVYARLGVRFDVVLGESWYRDRLPGLVDELLERGIAVPSEGAVVVPFGPEDGAELAQAPLLIRKRDGASLYGTTDLATIEHRLKTWAPAQIVYVTDTRQQLHFKQVFAAARRIGWNSDFRHCWFGMLRFGDGSIAATRGGGQNVNLVDVLDEAAARARAVVDERSADLSEHERAAIAEAVGLGAVRYADLSQNPQTDIVFEWDKMLSLQGNTAPYLMYAHARCCSILRRAGALDDAPNGAITLDHPHERALAMRLLVQGEVVLAAAATTRPNLLCDHLFQLAGDFARFYGECPVLHEDVPAAVRASRLGLVHATRRAMKVGLELLGITALDRM
jgi:arginyl-tRNA synthetase